MGLEVRPCARPRAAGGAFLRAALPRGLQWARRGPAAAAARALPGARRAQGRAARAAACF
jgi:hypothetical protein